MPPEVRTNSSALLIVAVSIFLFSWAAYGQRGDKAKVTWEYKAVPASELKPDYNYDEYLNKLGAQGWELVAVTGPNNTANTVMYLKRAK